MSGTPFVVVGAGQAGLQVCDSLRKLGYPGELVLIGAEASPPYQRPPLSKKFLTGDLEAERLYFRPASYYSKLDITLLLGQEVRRIDRQQHEVEFADGRRLAYAKLALTTGARIRPLQCPGAELADIFYIRTLDDSLRLRARLADVSHVTIVGGGFIGLEVAAMARSLGKQVVVLEALDRLMARAVSPSVSDYFAALHRDRGVDLRLSCAVAALQAEGNGTLRVITDQGQEFATDLLVVGIGVLPNTELAADAGLECRNGIVVDVHARTADPDIVAAGDCTLHYNGFLARQIRLESVQNAVDQAKVAAGSMVGHAESYVQVPWFWSDQYDVKLQMAGIGMPFDDCIERGARADGNFSIFYFRAGRLVGADSINRPVDHMACRKLLAQGTMVTPAELGREDVDLMQLART
jgi:3-phenylpropionate/trans-cinnamate dioxygenase ferredoxin reductase component